MVTRLLTFVIVAAVAAPTTARASDPILDWIGVMQTAVFTPAVTTPPTPATSPLVTTRHTGLVGAAIFDAVNGIEKRYQQLMVEKYRGPHASARAAAIQAAYAMLAKLYPARKADLFDPNLAASLAAIASGPGRDDPRSIAAGISYGQFVADTIFAARATDGFAPDPAPAFVGVDRVGFWRPTAAGATGASPQFASMTPWVMIRASQFRPAPPPALGSDRYMADYDETKTFGAGPAPLPGVALSENQSVARFWNGNTALYWNRIAAQVAIARNLSLVETAHLFGLLNVAMADAGVACWDAKYRYVFWRPVTAIQQSGRDGSPIGGDSAWVPFLPVTPSHPEYPSGHSTLSGAAQHVLETMFGDNVAFDVESETMAGKIYAFTSFSAALAAIHNARVWGGIHFRTACLEGSRVGARVADWVMDNAMRERGER